MEVNHTASCAGGQGFEHRFYPLAECTVSTRQSAHPFTECTVSTHQSAHALMKVPCAHDPDGGRSACVTQHLHLLLFSLFFSRMLPPFRCAVLPFIPHSLGHSHFTYAFTNKATAFTGRAGDIFGKIKLFDMMINPRSNTCVLSYTL